MDEKNITTRLGESPVETTNKIFNKIIFILGTVALVMYVGILLITGGLS